MPLSPKYLSLGSGNELSPTKSTAIRDAINEESSASDKRRRGSSSAGSAAAAAKGKGKEVEEEQEVDDDRGKDDVSAADQRRRVSGAEEDSSDDDGDKERGVDGEGKTIDDGMTEAERRHSDGQPRWSHMNVRRMLQEVKKRAKTNGTPKHSSFLPFLFFADARTHERTRG